MAANLPGPSLHHKIKENLQEDIKVCKEHCATGLQTLSPGMGPGQEFLFKENVLSSNYRENYPSCLSNSVDQAEIKL